MMKPGLRKFALLSHIAASVGWLGAVAAFLALAIAGLVSRDDQTASGAYIAMELTGRFVIVPLGIAALLTGLVQSLGTKWGLFRHYWVLIKFLLTVGADFLLILHMRATSDLAGAARSFALSGGDLGSLRIRIVADAGAALLVLLIATVLSIYKPWGLTGYGLGNRKNQETPLPGSDTKRSWGFYVLIGLGALLILFILTHLIGGGHIGH